MNIFYRVGGENFYPLTRNVFLRNSYIDADQLNRSNGTPAEAPRSFRYFAAHEIGHSLTGERLGITHLWNLRLPQWIREGCADYIGLGGDVDVDAFYARYRAGDRQLAYAKSGQCVRFGLPVGFLIKRERWTVDRLFESGLSQDNAEKMPNASVKRRI